MTTHHLRELLARATPASEWRTQECSSPSSLLLLRGRSERPGAHMQSHLQIAPAEDAALICAAINALPALLDCADELSKIYGLPESARAALAALAAVGREGKGV